MLNSVNFDLQETPKKRSNSEIKPPYTETVPISKLLPYTKPKIEFGKCLSLDLYDPIIDPMGLDQLFESYKGRNSSVFGFSKWFFGNGTYEWRNCTIESFDKNKENFCIEWPNGIKKCVSRINLRFFDEDEKVFENRISEARKHRELAEISLRYNFLLQNQYLAIPDFPIKMMENILKLVKGKKKINLHNFRSADVYYKLPLEIRYNPKRFLWANENTHVTDETSFIKSKGFDNHSQYFEDFLNKVSDLPHFSYLKSMWKESCKQKLLDLAKETNENWCLCLKSIVFQSKNEKNIKNSVFQCEISNKNSSFKDFLSPSLPILSSTRFFPRFSRFKQNSFLSSPDLTKIYERITNTIHSLDNIFLFPEKGILPFTTDEFFLKLKETAEAFLNFVQNVVFDIQFDIQEILTKEEQKRIQRNMIKIKEKVYNTQSLELEESLPQSVISMTTKFVKVCNMKVEDKVRQNWVKSLESFNKLFESGIEVLTEENMNNKAFMINNLDLFEENGSSLIEIGLAIDETGSCIITNPLKETFVKKIKIFLNGLKEKISELRCIKTLQTGPARANSWLKIWEKDSKKYEKTIKVLKKNLNFQFTILNLFVKKIEPYLYFLNFNFEEISNFEKKSVNDIEKEIFRLKTIELEILEIFDERKTHLGIWAIKANEVKNSILFVIEKAVGSLFRLFFDFYAKQASHSLNYK